MSKYIVKFKLQGLEFEIEGEKDALPNIAGGIKDQFAALMAPVDIGSKNPVTPPPPQIIEASTPIHRRKSSPRRSSGKSAAPAAELPTLVYDPSRHGSPVQSWKAVDKAFWLLRVLTDSGVSEASGTTLAALFEKHFRRKGSLRPSNIGRDFGKSDGLVAENTNSDPSTWYLLDGGTRHTTKLISEALQSHEVSA